MSPLPPLIAGGGGAAPRLTAGGGGAADAGGVSSGDTGLSMDAGGLSKDGGAPPLERATLARLIIGGGMEAGAAEVADLWHIMRLR